MTDTGLPADEPERERIRHDLDATLFVEAGAGSGKTTALVERVANLVHAGVELQHIAAITFTEKAGAELRDKVRHRLTDDLRDPDASPERIDRSRLALEQLDSAAIGTLHSFAQRILSEHPVEARLPPRVEVQDEVTSGIAFDRRWARTLDALLDDPDLERTLLLLTAAKVDPASFRALAVAFDGSWDLVEDLVPEISPEPPPVRAHLSKVADALHTASQLVPCCDDPDDSLLARLLHLAAFGERLDAIDDDLDLLDLLQSPDVSFKAGNLGRKDAWNGRKPDAQDAVVAVGTAVEAVTGSVLDACAHRLGSAMRAFTLRAATDRRRAGQLEFHDLLVLARQVLRDPEHGPDVRASLHRRYQRVLLDEFQDTDPIQIELAVRITAADPAEATGPWDEVEVAPGRLFVVGDPKQSIYRFRRADISTFLEARRRFGGDGDVVVLSENFRTVSPIIGWVNATFGALMGEASEVEVPWPSQPEYAPLVAAREEVGDGPTLAAVGMQEHPAGTKADLVRAAEARDVAHAITVVRREGWQIRDDDGTWREADLGDITILVPARTSLPFLEDALGDANIPFRAESSSLVYATRAVRDLMLVLRAADDPTDHLRIVAALRTPLLGCGDDDLFRHRVVAHGSWSYNTPTAPDPSDGPVAAGLSFLRAIHEARHWESPAELLDRIARDRRALELGFAEGRPRDVWRRLRFVIDQARAWSESTGGSLRTYLQWVDQQTVEGARVSESVLPELDDDAVRIMTIHAAKGLEFPITIVSGLSTGAMSRRNPVDVHFPRDGGKVGYRLGKEVTTDEFEAWKPIDEQMDFHERIRLLYVACTRAQDHLIVSLHRVPKGQQAPNNRSNALLLHDGMGADRLADLVDLSGVAEPLPVQGAALPEAPVPLPEWRARRDAAAAAASIPGAVAATALTDDGGPEWLVEPASDLDAVTHPTLFDAVPDVGDPGDDIATGLRKRPVDLDLPPWLKGRYGTAVGRAVHGVLQTIDLATGAGLEAAVAAQVQAEAIVDRAGDVERLARDALASPSVAEGAGSMHWREVYAATPIGGRVLEGYLDLLYRSDDGLVVVDYKTAGTADPAELDRHVEGYRLQGAAYALTIGRSTGEPVARVVFVFLTPNGAVEIELDDLDASMAQVEALVAAGQELVTT